MVISYICIVREIKGQLKKLPQRFFIGLSEEECFTSSIPLGVVNIHYNYEVNLISRYGYKCNGSGDYKYRAGK